MNTLLSIIIIAACVLVLASVVVGYFLLMMTSKTRPIPDEPKIDEKQAVSASEEKQAELPEKEGEYTGILHVSNGRFKFERPVMSTLYRNRPVYFTYNEAGKRVVLSNNPKLIEDIKTMLEDHTYKCKNLKWYPIDEK